MDFTREPRRGWRPDVRSIALGALFGFLPLVALEQADAFDLGAVGKSISNLANIKKNLDGDVKLLTADAKTLLADKDKMLQIKDQLIKLAKDTKTQVDSISGLVGEVEGHLKKTQSDISTTSGHVGEIDAVRKALGGK